MVLFITFTIDSGKILYNKPAFTNTSTISYSSVSRVKFSYLKTNFKDNIFKLCTPQKTLHLHYKDKSVNYENNQKEALYILIYYSKSALHVSGDVSPIIRSTWLYLLHLLVFTQQDALYIYINLLFQVSSTCFGQCFRPSSGALGCIYSIW